VRFLKFHCNSSREKSERAESVCEREGMNKFASARVCVWYLFCKDYTRRGRRRHDVSGRRREKKKKKKKKNDKNN
jgi:hypothetical protein